MQPLHKMVSGIRATLGVRSGAASLEEFSYDGAPSTGSRLRLHLTIDQSFKDRLAQAKKTTAAGQWSPISPMPVNAALVPTSGHNYGWEVDSSDCSGNFIADLAAVLDNGAHYVAHGDHGYAQQMTMETPQCSGISSAIDDVATATATTTPADLSDLSTLDLLQFPADWNVELTDVDVDADFSPLTDIRPPITDLGSLFLPMGADCVASDQSRFLGGQLPTVSELLPVYDDNMWAFAVDDDTPWFDGIEHFLWNTSNMGHAISVQ